MATITRMTAARIPADAGEFYLYLYRTDSDDKEHLALVLGDVAEQEKLLVRLHSECFTGDVLGSLRCDCGPQLQRAMELIAQEGAGVIVYLRQEGRGIGLLDKLRAYNLQDEGYDTVEANLLLGHEADARDYTIAALILQDLAVRSVRLLTNNPLKMESLEALGVPVAERVPLQTAVTPENARYLATKVERMRHLLQLDPSQPAHPERPFVTLSYAQSLDGSISAQQGQPFALSGPESLRMTHQLRAEHDAILVGIGTVLADDPRLTVRFGETDGRQPRPIVLDSHLRLPLTAKLLQHPQKPWVITTEQADNGRWQALTAAGAVVWHVPANAEGRVALPAMLALLGQQGIGRLMVEGGASIITRFLSQRLVDQLVITIAPVLMGGFHGLNTLLRLNGSGAFPHLQNPHTQWLGKDMVISGAVRWEQAKSAVD